MKRKRTTAWLATALFLTSLLAACGQSSLEIGMVETNLPGHWEASYTTFTGTKADKIRADAGQILILEYEVKADKGDLSIELNHSEAGTLWDVTLQENAEDIVKLALEQDGPYTITIEGENTGGSFDLSWELE
jgi:hypothetical protein